MDERRMQAYVGLIEQLLGCPQGEEGALLNANMELVDADLLKVMRVWTDLLEERGDKRTEQWQQLTRHLLKRLEAQKIQQQLNQQLPAKGKAQSLGLGEGTPSSPASRNAAKFGLKIINLIAHTQGDQVKVYEFFRENVGHLNESLLLMLPNIFTILIQQNDPPSIADVFSDFGNLIRSFQLGNQKLNVEISITSYELALQVRTRGTFPKSWAMIHNNLAYAYLNRIQGEHADNLECAISSYEVALQVITFDAFPRDWAQIQVNLAGAYSIRIRGEHADNLERAISSYEMALQFYSHDSFPEEWAITQYGLANAYFNRIRGKCTDNLECAITAYKLVLQVITCDVSLKEWVITQRQLGICYKDRIRGERANNLEDSIAAFELALQVYTYDAFPEEWATTQHNLALVYSERIRGKRANNLEYAIAAYELVLQVRTREAFPEEWATTQCNLANAYSDRIRERRVDNLECAVTSYKLALQVFTRAAFPEKWAMTKHCLARAYFYRIQGRRADNLEDAISTYKLALQVRTREAFPKDWAMTQNNLANAYKGRIRGEKADNLELAIVACELALQVRTRGAFPKDWATTQNNLALVYSDRIRGEKANNLELAITAYKLALQVRTREAFPEEWAMIQNNLANAYLYRIQGIRSDNLEDAIAAYGLALQVRTYETFPEKWAMTQNGLAMAWTKRIQDDRADNLDNAIAIYEQILQFYTHDEFPEQWAGVQHNLAATYFNRVRGEHTDNVKRAITSHGQALQVYTSDAFPRECRQTAQNLGILHFQERSWTATRDAYQIALAAAENLYQASISYGGKGDELKATGDIPRRLAYAQAQLGDFQSAVLTLEQSRARGLSESLDRDRANLTQLQQIDMDLHNKYQDITQQLRNLESRDRNSLVINTRDPEDVIGLMRNLRKDLEETIAQIRQVPTYEDFLMPTKWEDIEIALRSDNPLIYIVTTPNGSVTIVVTPENIEAVWSDFTEAQLQELVQSWFKAYKNSQTDRETWLNTIKATTRQLWDLLMGPIVQQLKTMGIDRATLIPTGYLSLLPLHAAWTPDPDRPTGKRYAIDDIHFTYTPNARSLTEARKIADRPFTDSILAIDNPRQDLPNSQREIDCAIDSFSNRTVLRHDNATIDAVKSGLAKAAIVHFSCHGTANFTEPLNSGLFMSDGLLTLKDLLALNLAQDSGIRLAILSACETGLPGLDNIDEVVSLPIGLLQAGVAGVISSLWSVDDASTMMLLTRFYDLWRKDGLEPAIALHQAQQWMHSTTDGEKADYCGFLTLTPDEYTYAHPFHWAAFSYLGV